VPLVTRIPQGLSLVLWRSPVAQGTLRPGVTARLVHQIWRSLSEGVLVLTGGGHERRFFFLHGGPVAVESDHPDEGLIGWLAAAGRVDAAARSAAEAEMAHGLSPGAALVAAGALEPGEPLQAAMRAHLEAQLARSVGAQQGTWRFHAGDEFAAQLVSVEVPPLQSLLEGARAHLPSKVFSDAMEAVRQAFPTRTQDFEQLLPALELREPDLALARTLDGRRTTRDVLVFRRGDLKEALSLLWFLSMIGAVVFHDSADPADAEAIAGPQARPPLPADRAEAIRQVALRILPGTFYQALGVDITADGAEVERAYREMRARFDPLAFADYRVGELDDLLRAVQDKVTAAHRVLSCDEQRRQYLAFLLDGAEPSGLRVPGIVLDAEVALRRGERALRGRRNAEAVSALTEAVEKNPREPVYQAMLAFAELYDPVLPASARAVEARNRARAALALDPTNLRALVVLALAENLAGDPAAARAAVDAALHAHPGAELAHRVHLRLLQPART
jgi:tetratricopeptide (TPR) repeat protein